MKLFLQKPTKVHSRRKIFWLKKLKFAALAGLIGIATRAQAGDLIEVLPVTNKILMVYIEDGHVDHHGDGENKNNNVIYHSATDLARALDVSNYQLSSSNDANYSNTKSPINIGRKSKGIAYNNEGAEVPYAMGHWIYIELPTAMVQGKNYKLRLVGVVENLEEYSFVYDVNKIRSETVHVNQIGFPQSGPKYAYLSHWMGDFDTNTHSDGGLELDSHQGYQFRLINFATGGTAYTGTITKRMDKTVHEASHVDYAPEHNYTLADVWQCDFSNFTTPGEYVVAVDGIGRSFPFQINNNSTTEPFFFAMKGLFYQRHGVEKELDNGTIMPRDHHYDDINWYWDKNWDGGHNTDGFNTASPQVDGIYGYYHDAGDWDGYITHAKIPMLLLLLYDLEPSKFYDGEIGNKYRLSASSSWIDEGNNGVPDLLDEASWLVKYYKRARNILKDNYGATGGVPAYVGRDAIPGGNTMTAWQDMRDWYVSKENREQTYLYAGLAAWYAICLNDFHQLTGSGSHPESASWIAEATSAYNWANGKAASTDDKEATNEERAKGLAAAAIYRVTGNTTYQNDYISYYNNETNRTDGEWSNPYYFNIANSIYALAPSGLNGLNTSVQNAVKQEVIALADDTKVNHNQFNAFRAGVEEEQFLQLGALTTPRLTIVPVAYELTGDPKYLDVVNNASNYVLGGNQLNMVYISGLGERSDQGIFNPNGYLINDYNSMVYENEPHIGYTSYFAATPNSPYWFLNSTHSEYFTRKAAYPQLADNPNTWPEAEVKFNNFYSIQGGEFTTHQQSNYMIYTMGYRKAKANASANAYTLNARPTVSLNLSDGQDISKSNVNLTASASNDTRSVKYYYEWHYIGESTDKANNFSFTWNPPLPQGESVLVTAVALDDRGRMSVPSANGDKNVDIVAQSGDDVTAPSTPTGLSSSNTGYTSTTLSWNASSDANGVRGYEVYKDGTSVGFTVETSFAVEELSPATTYSFTVRARDAEYNWSTQSSPRSVTTDDVTTGPGTVFSQDNDADGLVEMEGEHYSERHTGTGNFANLHWLEYDDALASNGEYVMVQNNNSYAGGTLNGPRIDFFVNFVKSVPTYVWVRTFNPSSGDDSVVPAVNGSMLGEWSLGTNSSWGWRKSDLTFIPSTGQQTFSIYMREDGAKIDKVLLTTNPDYVPSNGTGTADYSLNVGNGSGDGSYAFNESVTITANEAPSGQVFDKWTGNVTYVDDVNNSVTTVTMPAANVSITATYKQVATCSAVNLNNPGFESGLTGWTINGGAPVVSTDQAQGSKAAEITGGTAGIQQVYTSNITLGTTVTLSFAAKISSGSGWSGVGIDFKDAAGTLLTSSNVQVTGTVYQSYSIVQNAPAETASITIWAYSASGSLFFDAVCVDGVGSSVSGSNIQVYARGVQGVEDLQLRIGSATASSTKTWTDIGTVTASLTYTHSSAIDFDDVFIYFDDASGDIILDKVILDGVTRQAEAMQINTAAWDGACGAGSFTESMNCEGYVDFGSGTSTPVTYPLSVTSGSGDGSYASGVVVNITADAAPSGQVFDKWTGNVTNVADINDPTTTITMPSSNTSISATYKTVTASGSRLEAENATYSGGTLVSETSASNGQFVDGNGGFNITWTYNAASAGQAELQFALVRYSGTRTVGVFVNNTKVGTVTATADRYNWEEKSVTVNLVSGANTIELRDSEGTAEPDVDYVDVIFAAQDPTYSINLSSPNGSIAKNPNKSAYNAGESVTLTATDNSGYTFSNWSGDASGTTNPLTITMNSNKNITANFSQVSTPSCHLNQAETGYSGSGVSVVSGNGSTGSGYVDFGGQGTYSQWTVNVPSSGSYTLRFKYANGSSGDRQCALIANGAAVGNVRFGPSGGWQTWIVEEITATLNAGNNTIRLTANTSAGGPNLDSYEVCSMGASGALALENSGLNAIEGDEAQEGISFSVFPNPLSKGDLNVAIQNYFPGEEKIEISLTNVVGKVFYSQKLDPEQNIHHVIDCSSTPHGVYLIKIIHNKWQKTSKVIIK